MAKGTTVFVGNLPKDINDNELEGVFAKHGRVNSVKIRSDPSRSAKFAFIEFDDGRDALKAKDACDGYDLDGHRLIVDMAKDGGMRRRPSDNQDSGYKVEISNLPKETSWQDLRNNFVGMGKILFTDVDRRGGGFVNFACREDAKQFVRNLDDTKFTLNNGQSSYIRVKEGKNREGSPRGHRSPVRRSQSPHRRSPARRTYSRSPRRRSPARRTYSRSRSPPRKDRYQNPRHYSPARKNRSPHFSPGRLTRSPIEEFGRKRNLRRSGSPPPNVWARSPPPNKRGRSRSPSRSFSPFGDMRKRSRSSSSSSSHSRRHRSNLRSPPPTKRARSNSRSPKRVYY